MGARWRALAEAAAGAPGAPIYSGLASRRSSLGAHQPSLSSNCAPPDARGFGGHPPARRPQLLRAALLAVAFIFFFAAVVPAQELEQVVDALEATYGKMTDLRADFTQVARNKSLGQDVKAEGTVYLKKGGKMRWDYKTPSPQQIVSDGTHLWVYTPELNQVNKGDAPKSLAGPAGSFLQGLGKVREEFAVRFLNPANKTDASGRPVLDLTPKKPTPLLTRLVLTLDPKESYVVRQAVLYDQLQNTVTMSFNRVLVNPGLSDTLFAFTPPKGTAVVPLEIR